MSNNITVFENNARIASTFHREVNQFREDFARNGAFGNFRPAREEGFSEAPHLDLRLSCPVLVLPSQDGRTHVAIDADWTDLKNFNTYKSGDTVSIRQERASGTSVHISGNSRNIHIVSSSVTINGVRMRHSSVGATSEREPRVIIAAPAAGNIEAHMSGQATLLSAVFHRAASLDLSGQCKVAVAAENLGVDIRGQGVVLFNVGGGALQASASGIGGCRAFGEFSNVRASLSGIGSIETTGTVAGDYKADVSGMGCILHHGAIRGHRRTKVSGLGRIDLG